MRLLLALVLLAVASPASAQLLVPFTTPNGLVACTQGMTGIGRPPDWHAVADPDAPDGWALAETAADPNDLRFPLCVSPNVAARDFEASLRFKPVSGTRAQVGGLMFRAIDANDYYVVRANSLDNSVRLYRVEKGKRSQLASKQAPIEAGRWHTLKLTVLDDRIEVGLDGEPLFTVTDRSLRQPGAIGVWSQADSVTHYGTLLVSSLPR